MIISLKSGPSGGLDVPEASLSVLFGLLNRDLTLRVEGESLRIACADGSRPEFSEAERGAIVQWKEHLKALVLYEPPELA